MSIGGLSSATSSSVSALRGYSGLASGLDRDTMIEQMTAGTQAKIDKQNQEKTKLTWEQESIREITDKLYDFTQKYTSYTSSSNMLSGAFYNRTDITVNGANGKYISVTGSTTSTDLIQVLGVKQLANRESLTTTVKASDTLMSLGSVSNDLSVKTEVDVVAGESIFLKYGNTAYTLKLGLGDDYDYGSAGGDAKANADKIAEAINKSMQDVNIGDGKKLSDVMSAEATADGKISFRNKDTAGNTISIIGATGDVLKNLGFTKDITKDKYEIAAGSSLTAESSHKAVQEIALKDQIKGQSFIFTYNNSVKSISVPQSAQIDTMEDLKNFLQKEIDNAFGSNRIEVSLKADGADKSALSFRTTLPKADASGTRPDDESSVLIMSATGRLTGEKSVFGVSDGVSNRLNTSETLDRAGLNSDRAQAAQTILGGKGDDDELTLTVNGAEIKGITKNSTIDEIMSAINNNQDAKVNISYQRETDRFIVTSTQNGASGSVDLDGEVAQILGLKKDQAVSVTEGQDAIIAVKYAGTDKVMEINRDSNVITVDGLNITVNGEFGYTEQTDASGQVNKVLDTSAEAVTFTAKADSEKALETVKTMIEEYNEIVKLVNDKVGEKPNRDYAPLTSSQKKDLSEDEIKLWETEAKKGLLFNDTDVRGLADAMRFIIPENLRSALSEIGISTSSDYSANGQLTLDETKFKAAFESNPENVKALLSAPAGTDENGNSLKGGLMTNMKTVMNRYAGTEGAVKGILIERAGSSHSPLSMLDNSITNRIEDIDDRLITLLNTLKMEQDRYISQFTRLEMIISQMNSQSAYLTQMLAG